MKNSDFKIENYFIQVEDRKDYKSSPYSPMNDRALFFSDEKYRNIIMPNNNAKYLLANYYKEKYDIDIFVLLEPTKLRNFIDALKQRNINIIKVGIIITSGEAKHSIPMIYEKKGANEILIVFDSRGHKGAFGFGIDKVDEIVNANQNTSITIYSNGFNNEISAVRQADFHSCHNDAFLILKEALQSDNIVNELRDPRLAHYQSTQYFSFLLPEKWSKSVQIPSYLGAEGMKSNLEVPISKETKSKISLKENKKDETLGNFIARSTVVLEREEIITRSSSPLETIGAKTGKIESKKMNIYLKLKGYDNVKKVIEQFNKHISNLEQIYHERSGEHLLEQYGSNVKKCIMM